MNAEQTIACETLRAMYSAAKAGGTLDHVAVHTLIKVIGRSASYATTDGQEGREKAAKATAAFEALGLYPVWESRHSGEDFDRTQGLAQKLTDADRAAGRKAPACGYSAERIEEARAIVKAANRWS
jgi:hypothetical protein